MEEDPLPKIVGNEYNEKSSSWREDTWEGIRRVLGRGPRILYDSPENSSQEVDFVPKYHEPSDGVDSARANDVGVGAEAAED
ncbi:hypothetical protein CJ030_MR3G005576 [Morella rubra]|uniref:Uncharacterized protein n=1 Tax=Morella rubra TaxID=262757 RepID=A0A6A1W4B6_9ROSI|nr:hypothetical protein CJ030_MR3G005576 [Morella rubra]